MRILVVGTVPPPGGPSARALAEEAMRLADAGHEVEVLSPDVRASAHYHARLEGFFLPFRLAAASRRFDAVLLRLEPGLPFRPATHRVERAALGSALSWAVRGFSEVRVWSESPMPIPGGPGGRAVTGLWAKASEVVVASEEDRLQLLAVPGMGPERVRVSAPLPVEEVAPSDGWPSGGADARAEILDLVRERARQTRRMALAGARLGGATERAEEIEEEIAAAEAQSIEALLLSEGDPTLQPRALLRLVAARALRAPRRIARRVIEPALRPVRRVRNFARRKLQPFG